MKQLKTKISHCEKELKEKKNQLKSKQDEATSVENELKARRKDVENIKTGLESLPYKEDEMEALQKVWLLFLMLVSFESKEVHKSHLSIVNFSLKWFPGARIWEGLCAKVEGWNTQSFSILV